MRWLFFDQRECYFKGRQLASFTGFDARDDILIGSTVGDLISGLAGNDQLFGMGGSDTLNGGAGRDRMDGGIGNDVYYVDNVQDRITENSGDTGDLVITRVSFTQPQNVEYMKLEDGYGALNGTGNTQHNTIYGNASNNVILGLAGNDTLDGMGGNDVINGGLGTDWLTGGAGNDTFAYASYSDSSAGHRQWDTIADLGNGADKIDLSLLDPNIRTPAYNVADTFIWRGALDYTPNVPGQARYDSAQGLLLVSNDTDITPEFAIYVGTQWTADQLLSFLIL